MSLGELLRDPPHAVRALLDSAGVPRALLSEMLDDLAAEGRATGAPVARAEPWDAPNGRAIRERAAAITALGESVSRLVEDGVIVATAKEMSAVHGWVRTRLLACVDELAAYPEMPDMRLTAIRNALAAAEMVFVEFDRELRVRWTPDFDRAPFDRAIVGRPAEELLGRNDGGQLPATVRRVIATGIPERAEVTISPRVPPGASDLEQLEIIVAVEPLKDAAGVTVGAICASMNVTELKRTQLALREALHVRDLMMAVLAHDLRNPLSTVRALSFTFARSDALPEKVRQGLAQVESASRRMEELIGTLLDFSAARGGGSIPVVRVRTDAHAVILGVVEELRQAMPHRRLTLTCAGDTAALLDGPRIAQVVSNLVGNALTHGSPTQPVEVTLDAHDAHLVLAVRNQGPTIPPAVLPVLFEPFRRGVSGESRPRGLGLGLYIAREIVRAHQGTIEVESTEERGTIFTVRLPREGSSDLTS